MSEAGEVESEYLEFTFILISEYCNSSTKINSGEFEPPKSPLNNSTGILNCIYTSLTT